MENDAFQTEDIDALRRLAGASWRRAEALTKATEQLAEEKKTLADKNKVLKAKNVALETELGVLLSRISKLTVKLAKATHRDVQEELELELKTLRQQLAEPAQEAYGTKSERRNRDGEKPPKKGEREEGTWAHGPAKPTHRRGRICP